MLTLTNIKAGYDNLEILRGISLTINPNEIVALIGPNGAGKTTAIKSIFSLAQVYRGKIIFKGKDITRLKTHELLELGISYVPQGKINFPSLTVEENLLLGTTLLKDKEVIIKNLSLAYKKFPLLAERRRDLAFSLSGGQQQMLALGRALMQNPSLLLLDEPSLGLSPKIQKQLFAMIKELSKEGIAILIVEQNAKKAIEIAHTTYLLEDGLIVVQGGKDIIQHAKIKEVYLGGRY